MKKRPQVLTIAGFDPSSGAGITADIKTFEKLKCYGLAVQTANTIQNDIRFESCYWMPENYIKNQINILFDRFTIEYVKIGIVENWNVLIALVDFLILKKPTIKIIVDPIIKSSTGYVFQSIIAEKKILNGLWDKVYVLTPNYNEISALYPNKTIEKAIEEISQRTNVYLKGGHKKEGIGIDELYMANKKHVLNPKKLKISEKHGSGCVISAAIVTYLALGYPLLKACFRAKRYTEKVLSSNVSLLGYHQ